MSKTNEGLRAHCEKALAEQWFYLWGAYGQRATQEYLERNLRQYPSNERYRAYALGAVKNATRFTDCYGLVKSYLWWTGDEGNPRYLAEQDLNTATAYSRASEKGSLATLPELPGVILWMQGHVGVYLGGGRFAECAGAVGMAEGKIAGGKVVRGSPFVAWFKDSNLLYTPGPARELEDALDALAAAGIINTPAYWLQNYTALPYLDQLILNMAAYVRQQRG